MKGWGEDKTQKARSLRGDRAWMHLFGCGVA